MFKSSISFIKAAKHHDNIDWNSAPLCPGQIPRFGYWWWFWFPSFRVRGKFWCAEVININLHWLCFCISVILWPKKTSKIY